MGDYGDVSGGYSDQAIRDIVAQLQSNGTPAAPPDAPAPASWAAPEVTPTMLAPVPQAAPIPQSAPMPVQQGPITLGGPNGPTALPNAGPTSIQGQPLTYAGFWPGAVVPAPAKRTAPDDWAPPAPTWTPPPVTPVAAVPMGALVAPRPVAPTMGVVLGRR